MVHSHGHGSHALHDHAPARYDAAFAIGMALNGAYIAIEAAFGFYADSLALLADAGHNLSDVIGLGIAWGAYWLSGVRPTPRRSYGWRSSTILAALANGVLLLVAVGAIAWEAVRRFSEPGEAMGGTLMIVAGIGVVVNLATAMLFMRGRHDDLNLRGAYLHMLADALVSVGVVVAGLLMMLTELPWIDPATSLVVAAVILWGTWGLLTESVNLALHAAPRGLDPVAVREYLESLPGVTAVHDVHVWAMSTTETALTAHLVRPEVTNDDALLHQAIGELHDRFGIEQVTLQIERDAAGFACREDWVGVTKPHRCEDHA
ncbi:MAG TPA: cation diffusion facilitator family transporter [Pirellulaceae bacterium]|jgi:cobalt-zinc-cadmium efflux system protein|nr:cation diffusion facilitator family transporter [Pirellulaceae bacterium]